MMTTTMPVFPSVTLGNTILPWGLADLVEYLEQYGRVIISLDDEMKGWLVSSSDYDIVARYFGEDETIADDGKIMGECNRVYFGPLPTSNVWHFGIFKNGKCSGATFDVITAVEHFLGEKDNE